LFVMEVFVLALELLNRVCDLRFSLLVGYLGGAYKRGDTWPHAVQMPIS